MKLDDYRKVYEDFSGKLSDVARQLAFAGIALIWLFKVDSKPGQRIPPDLLPPAALLAMGLFCDLLQYVFGTVIWQRFHRKHEKLRKSEAKDTALEAPWYYPIPINIAFLLKIVSIITGLAWIAIYAVSQWWL
jgi:hypothetical protein